MGRRVRVVDRTVEEGLPCVEGNSGGFRRFKDGVRFVSRRPLRTKGNVNAVPGKEKKEI